MINFIKRAWIWLTHVFIIAAMVGVIGHFGGVNIWAALMITLVATFVMGISMTAYSSWALTPTAIDLEQFADRLVNVCATIVGLVGFIILVRLAFEKIELVAI